MEQRAGAFRNPRAVGVGCAVAATGLGLGYMAAAGAPTIYLAVNALTLLMGLALLAVMRPLAGKMPRVQDGVILAFGAVLLTTALFGTSVEGASRWVRIASLTLQISLVLLPAMLVAFAQRRGFVSTLGMILAAVALALQPDRAMAAVLASSLAVLALRERDRWTMSALGASMIAVVVTLLRPDTLPAVPYVDQIFYSAFDVHALAGLAVVGGALLLVVPALSGLRFDADNRDAYAVFGVAWFGIAVAAALGNYPTPLVGYGGSAVLGYAFSLAFLPVKSHSAATAGARVDGAADAEDGRDSELRINIAYG